MYDMSVPILSKPNHAIMVCIRRPGGVISDRRWTYIKDETKQRLSYCAKWYIYICTQTLLWGELERMFKSNDLLFNKHGFLQDSCFQITGMCCLCKNPFEGHTGRRVKCLMYNVISKNLGVKTSELKLWIFYLEIIFRVNQWRERIPMMIFMASINNTRD